MKNEVAKTSAPPALLLQMAIEKGTDMEQLKQLMDLQERWEKKEAKKSFLKALSKFQSIVPEIKKTKTASITSAKGNFSYRFADLGTIKKSIQPSLNESGLSYRWEFDESPQRLRVRCLISHEDGHTEVTTMEAGMDTSGYKNDIQQKGSTQTYLQRYTLIGGLGLSTADEDNDGGFHKRTNKVDNNEQLSEDDLLNQWQQSVNGVNTRIALQQLFLKNKKGVEGNPKVQAIFKERETQLKKLETPKTAMP